MIPNKNKVSVTGNLTGEDVKMTLDADSTGHLMDLFTDLYADPELAVIREYSTNAFDAHRDAGIDKPIEFETPTALKGAFTIRDFGIGLNAEDIREIYSKYGASTKRETNDFSGVLGLGCKSALTLTDQFTVVGTKNGIRTTVSISRSEDGGGTMKILSEEETDASNGVEVIVPATYNYRTEQTVENFFKFWPEGSVLVNGQAPKHLRGIAITDTIEAYHHSYRGEEPNSLGRDYLVMGNVPYPTNFDLPVRVVAQVPIGSVDFPPNRESLRDTKNTRATIAAVQQAYTDNVDGVIADLIAQADSKPAAMTVYHEIKFLIKSSQKVSDIKWNGSCLPEMFEYAMPSKKMSDAKLREKIHQNTMVHLVSNNYGRGSYGRGKHTMTKKISRESIAANPLWFVNFDNKNWAAPTRRKLDAYIQAEIALGNLPEETNGDGVILVRHKQVPKADWVDPSRILDWQDVRAFTMPVNHNTPKVVGRYDIWKVNNRSGYGSRHANVPVAEIDQNEPLLWTTRLNHTQAELLNKLNGPTIQIAILPQRRVNKFLRTFPEALDVNVALNEHGKKWWNALPDAQKRMIRWSEGDRPGASIAEWFTKTPLSKIADPELRETVGLHRTYNKHYSLVAIYRNNFASTLKKKPLQFSQLEARYPLLGWGYGADSTALARDHALYYVNAVYTEKG